MKVSVPTNHNFYEESPLTEEQLMVNFSLSKKSAVKQLKNELFSSVFSLTTKSKSLEQLQ